MTKVNVQEWLDAIGNNSRSPEWGEIAPNLTYAFSDQRLISREYGVYRTVALNSADRAVHRVRMAITATLAPVIEDASLTLTQMVEAVFVQVEEAGQKYLSPFSPARLRAMIIYEIYAH